MKCISVTTGNYCELTDPQKVDLLTAALIAQKAEGTIDDINFDFIDPMQGLWHDDPNDTEVVA